MENKYIIKGNKKYIPVKIDNKWGVVSTDGTRIINTQYQGIGCTLGDAGTPVIILPDLVDGADAIICQKITDIDPNDPKSQGKKLYKMINTETKEEFGYDTSEIYSKYEEKENGENKIVYYMKLDINGITVRNIDIYQTFGKKSKVITSQDEIEHNLNNSQNEDNQQNNENANNLTNNIDVNNNIINNNLDNNITSENMVSVNN